MESQTPDVRKILHPILGDEVRFLPVSYLVQPLHRLQSVVVDTGVDIAEFNASKFLYKRFYKNVTRNLRIEDYEVPENI